MGAKFSSGLAATASCTVEVQAPAEVLWEVIADLRALPEVLSMVEDVRFTNDDARTVVGTKFDEIRRYKEHKDMEPVLLQKSVTHVSNEHPYALSLDVKSPDTGESVTNTSTLTVYDTNDGNSILVGTLAFVDDRTCQCYRYLYFHCYIKRLTDLFFKRELGDYGKVAEQRFQEKIKNENQEQ